MPDYSDKTLRETLGLTQNMSTLFLKAPSEYFAVLGKRPQPYNDVDGEYDFIHAFYINIQDLEGYVGIMLSKLSEKGILWVSWPIDAAVTDITESNLDKLAVAKGLSKGSVLQITDNWLGSKFQWRH